MKPEIKHEQLTDSVEDLLQSYKDLITLKVVEKASLGVSLSISGLLTLVIGIFVMLFTGMGLASWLGEYLKDIKLGYFIVGGFYALIFLILLLISKKVTVPMIRNLVIKNIYE